MFMLFSAHGAEAAASKRFDTITTEDGALSPNFLKEGGKFFFNERPVSLTAYTGGTANFIFSNGCLMLKLDASNESGGENYNLILPKFQSGPFVGKAGSEINLIWENLDGDDDLHLMFQNGSEAMWVTKGRGRDAESYMVEMASYTRDDDSGEACFYVPVYAIINETGGGAMFNPFGDGISFAYTGSALKGYTGTWETSDKTEYRQQVVINGKKTSVPEDWQSMELRPEGIFTYIHRYLLLGDWVKVVTTGKYAFFGRILAMKYERSTEYSGQDFNNLVLVEERGPADLPYNGVFARYVDDWNKDFLQIHGWAAMYPTKLAR